VTLTFAVNDPVYDAGDPQGKYFVCPDTMRVDSAGFFAPAFPSPGIDVTLPSTDELALFFDTSVTQGAFTIRNIGGSHVPTGVELNWFITGVPDYMIVDRLEGTLTSTTQADPIQVTLNRAIDTGAFLDYIEIEFLRGSLNTEVFTVAIPTFVTILEPVLTVTSDDFLPGTSTLDFGTSTNTLSLVIANTGQSFLDWRVDAASLPDWINLPLASGSVAWDDSTTITVGIARGGLAPGVYSYTFNITSDGGTQPITVIMTVP
jgi:hypothetical protein